MQSLVSGKECLRAQGVPSPPSGRSRLFLFKIGSLYITASSYSVALEAPIPLYMVYPFKADYSPKPSFFDHGDGSYREPAAPARRRRQFRRRFHLIQAAMMFIRLLPSVSLPFALMVTLQGYLPIAAAKLPQGAYENPLHLL